MAGILAPWGRQSRPRRALTYRNRGASTRRGKAKGASELEREVEASLSRLGLNPAGLQLERAESVLMEATQKHSNALENLRLLGTTISVGYSRLKYLTT